MKEVSTQSTCAREYAWIALDRTSICAASGVSGDWGNVELAKLHGGGASSGGSIKWAADCAI